MTRRTEQKPLGLPWRDEGEKRDEGRAEMKGEGREVANTTQWRVTRCRRTNRKKSITRKIYGVTSIIRIRNYRTGVQTYILLGMYT